MSQATREYNFFTEYVRAALCDRMLEFWYVILIQTCKCESFRILYHYFAPSEDTTIIRGLLLGSEFFFNIRRGAVNISSLHRYTINKLSLNTLLHEEMCIPFTSSRRCSDYFIFLYFFLIKNIWFTLWHRLHVLKMASVLTRSILSQYSNFGLSICFHQFILLFPFE